jgi:hypothetical protein
MSALPLGASAFITDAIVVAGTAAAVWAMAGGGFDSNSNAGKSLKKAKKERAQKLIPCDECSGKGIKVCQFWYEHSHGFDTVCARRRQAQSARNEARSLRSLLFATSNCLLRIIDSAMLL